MCNVSQDIKDKMEVTVRQFLDQGRAFTGFDVTKATREREGIAPNDMRHSDCRGAVHEMVVLSDACDFGHDTNGTTVKWKKTQTDVGNGQWAFLYYPETFDPKSYQPQPTRPRHPSTPSAPASQTMAVPSVASSPAPTPAAATPSDSGGMNADGTFNTDYRNRLLVRTKFCQHLGLKDGDSIYAVADPTKQVIQLYADPSKAPSTNGATMTPYKLTRDGDFCLYSATFRAAGLTGSTFKIDSSTPDVVEVLA